MKRRRGAGARNALGVLLIVFAVLVLGGLGGASFLLRAPPTDAETLCRTDAPPAAHTIILVDATDRLEARHRRKLRAVLAQERARLSRYDRLTLMRINVRRPQEPSILFSRCLPRPPEQTNPLFENARMTQARWDEAFAQALDRALRSAGSSGPARASPIIAALRAVAADPEFGSEIPRRRLVLVSDLLEHNPQGFSLYVSDANYASWRAGATSGPPDLARVDLRIVPLDRPDHAEQQTAALESFWPAFFDGADVQSVTVDPAP
ncbi:MAG TPA: hypothetical protein VEF55_12240 [Candidatus Binatia bacterium]|nr:hypothetical protein [Candidatus Binatia bacterium]